VSPELRELLSLVLPALLAAAGAWGAVRAELRYIKLQVQAAHRRLDSIAAPAAPVEF
jgi:hypothetical protein